jgi:hypothetical protein
LCIWYCQGQYGGETDVCEIMKIKKEPKCDRKRFGCVFGVAVNKKNNSDGSSSWDCQISNKREHCQIKAKEIDGICGEKINECKKGVLEDIEDDEIYIK